MGTEVSASPKFVNRKAEMTRLISAFEGAAKGEGHLLVLGGEPGVGKTRLLRELAAEAKIRGAAVGFGTALAESVALYHPWTEALQELGLLNLLDEPSPPQDPQIQQMRLFNNIATGLAKRADRTPLLLILDDLQWADPSSFGLLQYVARNTRRARILLLGAYRTEAGSVRPRLREAFRKMAEENLTREITLRGIAREHLRELTMSFLGRHSLPDEFLELLWTETEGNPLFVREILRNLEEEGGIRTVGAAKRLTRPVDSLRVPERVREVIRARLARLSTGDRELLEAAAACGTRFTASLVARVAREDEERVLRGLGAIAQIHGLLQPRGSEYVFNHSAIQEEVYEGLSAEVRRAYHREAAEWLELAGGRIEDIAEQYYMAGDARAMPKLREAADAALVRHANDEAVRLLGEALELATASDRAELLELHADACESSARYEESIEVLRNAMEAGAPRDRCWRKVARALERLGRFDDSTAACRDGLSQATGEERARLYTAQALILYRKGTFDAAIARVGDALAALMEGGDPRDRTRALEVLGLCQNGLARYDEALRTESEILSLCRANGDRRGEGLALNVMGNVAANQGNLASALRFYEQSMEERQAIGDRQGVGDTLNNLGLLHYRRGDPSRSLEYLERALVIAESIGRLHTISAILQNMGNIYVDRVELDRGLDCYHRALAISKTQGDMEGIAQLQGAIGNVHMLRGDLAKALGLYEKSLEIAESIGGLSMVVYALSAIGDVYMARGDSKQALQAFERGLTIAEKIGDVEGQARSLMGIGSVKGEERDSVGVPQALRGALGLWTKLGNRPERADCHSTLARWFLRTGGSLEARENAERALALAREGGWPNAEAKARRALGCALAAAGKAREAREMLLNAVEMFTAQKAALDIAKTHLEWGLAERDLGDSAAARRHLGRSADLFHEAKVPRQEERAREILASLTRGASH